MSQLAAAVQLREAGYTIFPVRSGEKRPAVPWATYQSAPPAIETVLGWWGDEPAYNIGFPTGSYNQVVVLDIDEMTDEAQALLDAFGDRVPAVATPSGGVHLYFRWEEPTGNAVRIVPGVDVRGDGGYVLVPPSAVGSGPVDDLVGYRAQNGLDWTQPDVPFSEVFAMIGDGLRAEPSAAPSSTDPWVAAALARTPEPGEQADLLARLAGYFAGRQVPEDVTVGLLWGWLRNAQFGDPRWPWVEADVERTVRSIYAREGRRMGPVQWTGEGAPPDPELPLSARIRPASEFAKECDTVTDWIVEDFVAPGSYTGITAPPKTGKSTLACAMFRAILDGAPFLGRATEASRILYVSEQSGKSLAATLERGGLLERDDVYVVTAADLIGTKWDEAVPVLVEFCRENDVGVLVMDTLPRIAGVEDENSATDARASLAPLQLAKAANLAVVLIFHEPKGGRTINEAIRGSSAYAGEMDILMQMQAPKGEEDDTRKLKFTGRFSEAGAMLLQYVDGGYACTEGGTAQLDAQVLERALSDTAQTVQDLAERCRMSEQKVRKALKELQRWQGERIETVRLPGKGAPKGYRLPAEIVQWTR